MTLQPDREAADLAVPRQVDESPATQQEDLEANSSTKADLATWLQKVHAGIDRLLQMSKDIQLSRNIQL